MEERVQRANRQRPNNKQRKIPPLEGRRRDRHRERGPAAAFDGAFTAEEATIARGGAADDAADGVLVDLRARLANLKRDIEAHARGDSATRRNCAPQRRGAQLGQLRHRPHPPAVPAEARTAPPKWPARRSRVR